MRREMTKGRFSMSTYGIGKLDNTLSKIFDLCGNLMGINYKTVLLCFFLLSTINHYNIIKFYFLNQSELNEIKNYKCQK